MTMSSYDVVRRAIEFGTPARLPVRMDSLGISDVHSVGWNQIGAGDRELSESLDEWGCKWVRSGEANMGQVKGHPLDRWDNLSSFDWPDPDEPSLYEGMEAQFAGSEGKYVITSIFMLLFERLHALRGFENALADLHLDRTRIAGLADRVVEYDLAIIDNIARRFPGRIHGFAFTDDWGTQRGVFVRPSLWEEVFKPRYRHIFEAAHGAGWHVWMHSCGKVNAYLDGLVEVGLDVINLQQPRALGIEEVGKRFRGRLCFESLCDIQHTLPMEGANAIEKEARLLLREWATPEGGFVLSDYGDGRAIGVELQKKQVMLGAFRDADPWRRARL